MFWLKCCPRCNGDLYEEKDIHGSYINCLQCSNYLTEADQAVLWATSSLNTEAPYHAPMVVGYENPGGLKGATILELNRAA